MYKYTRMTIMTAITCISISGGVFGADDGSISIDLAKVAKSNIPNVAGCITNKTFVFKSADPSPAGEAFFFVAYEFQVKKDGMYRIMIKGAGSGNRTYSRYSMAIDSGEAVPVLSKRIVTASENGSLHEQGPVKLATGNHTLEFRLYPEQRMRDMNRVNERFVGHSIRIDAVSIDEVPPPLAAAPATAARKDGQKLLLKNGDRIVMLGDSITEEGFYAQHFVRLLKLAYPDEVFTIYNAGIALNRTMEGLERLELDVLALHPQWVIVAFGVNDSVHIAPDQFIKNYREIVTRLKRAGINVLCATPSGMIPGADANGQYFHTPDRARGFDATMAVETAEIIALAKEMECPCADVFGAFTRAGLDRKSLMGSQWHPGREGGRLFALALLRSLGFSQEDAARTKDAADLNFYKAIESMTAFSYPRYNPASIPAENPGDGLWVAASSFTGNTVQAFSLETGKQVACVAVGHHPMGLAYNSKRKELYVACEGSGRLDVIAIPKFEKTGTIELGDVYPVSIALSEDGATAWTANFFGCNISEIDLAGRKVKRTIPLGNLGESVLLCQDGKTLLAATRKFTACIDLQKGEITDKINTSEYSSALFMDSKGQIGAIDTEKWVLFPIDVQKKAASPSVAAPFQARALIADPQTHDILAGDCGNNEIVRISAANGEKRKVAEVQYPFGLAIIDPK